MDWAIAELVERGIGLFYFCLNPDSEDVRRLAARSLARPPPAPLFRFW